MAIVELLDLSAAALWNDCLHKLPDSRQDIYFTPSYYRLYEELGDGIAKCIIFTEGDNLAIYPVLLNSINKLGYVTDGEYYDLQGAYGYNGILFSSDDRQFVKQFFVAFADFCVENNVVAEFMRLHPLINNHVLCEKYVSAIKDRETVVINLEKDYWNCEYSSNNRNMIRKALKSGYQIQILDQPTEKDIKAFVDIYYCSMNMINADKYYYFPQKYFINMFRYFNNHVFLFNVIDPEYGIVCSAVFMQYGNYFHYHLSGRNRNADNSANNYLLNKAAEFAKENGASKFHLGGGRSSADNDSLLLFKKNFSKQTIPFYLSKRVLNETVYSDIVNQWALKYPEKNRKYGNYLLKYRY
jgi:hypothetical protein